MSPKAEITRRSLPLIQYDPVLHLSGGRYNPVTVDELGYLHFHKKRFTKITKKNTQNALIYINFGIQFEHAKKLWGVYPKNSFIIMFVCFIFFYFRDFQYFSIFSNFLKFIDF